MNRVYNFQYYDKRFLISKLLSRIDRLLFKHFLYCGFCLHCFKFTFNLHDSSDQSYHCYNCCWEKELICGI